MTGPPLDPARGAEVAKELRRLGVKGILITAAELGYITEVKCGLCNRIDYSRTVGRSHERDLERIRKTREAAVEAQELFTWRKGDATYTPPPQDDGEEVRVESNEEE